MKKITLLFSFVLIAFFSNAQVKITFEDAEIGSAGGAVAVWDAGTVSVVANTYTTGNPSAKALRVVNNDYLAVYFGNVPLPAAAETQYSLLRVKYLVVGGSDVNYPDLEIFSSPNSYTAGETEKIATLGRSALWGDAEIGVWKTVEFTFSTSLIKPVPAGNLILKLVKSSCEYLIDDIELVPVPTSGSIFTVNDFESNTIGDIFNMKRWNTPDGTATVAASPTDAANKVVHIVTSNWDAILKLSVVLPSGKVLSNYEKLMFDLYTVSGFSNNYKNMNIYIDDTKKYEETNYPAQATDNTWTPKSYTIDSTWGNQNSFVMDLGISTDNGNYYMDNIKMQLTTTGVENQLSENPLIIFSSTNAFVFSREVDVYELFDTTGKRVAAGNNAVEISTVNLNKGVYILKARISKDIFTTKLMK